MNTNHRTRVDWMMIWPALIRFEIIQFLIIVSRKLLRLVPVIGWCFCWIAVFLERSWDIDKSVLIDMIKILSSTTVEPRSLFLFFPEGTDLWEKSIASSNKYADKNGLTHYKYVLHPRTKGLKTIINVLNENLFAICDATIGYVDYTKDERCNELFLAAGRYPKEVLFYFETFTLDDIIKQYKEKYGVDSGDDDQKEREYTMQSYMDNDGWYEPSPYVPKNERMQFVDIMDKYHDVDTEQIRDTEMEIINNAIDDFIKKSFERKEIRLKEWYENGKWIEDEKYKIEYNFIPRSDYIIALIMFVVQCIGFIWLWKNMRWYIWLICAAHIIFSIGDTVGKIIRSHREWVCELEKQRKTQRKHKKHNKLHDNISKEE